MDPLFPAFPQKRSVRVNFAWGWMPPPIRLRLLQQILPDCFPVQVELFGDRRYTPPLLLQISYVHKSLQVEHWTPYEPNSICTWGIFNRRTGELSIGGFGEF